MSWILSTVIEIQFLSTWYVYNFYQVDMCWISINLIEILELDIYQVDTTPISIKLIRFQILSTEYALDIYQHSWNSHFYSCWYVLDISTWYVLDIYQVDRIWILISVVRTPNSIHGNMFWIFISMNRTPIYQLWYVLDIYQRWYNSHFYFHEYVVDSISMNRLDIYFHE